MVLPLSLPLLAIGLLSPAGDAFVAQRIRPGPGTRTLDTTAQCAMSSPKVDFEKTETVGSTRWMRLETLTYKVEDGTERKW